MLQCCESRPKTLSVPEFFAVGKTFRAFLFRVVKGGVPLSKNLNICDYQGSSEPSYWKLSFHKSFDTTQISLNKFEKPEGSPKIQLYTTKECLLFPKH